MPLSVNFTRLMYVGLAFSVPGVSIDLDSAVLACGSSAKHNAAPKKQSPKINPVVFVFMGRSNLDLDFPSTFLCSRTNTSPLFEIAHAFLRSRNSSLVFLHLIRHQPVSYEPCSTIFHHRTLYVPCFDDCF